ncbi:response regulator [Salinimicrobium sp. CAU 1759]
MSRSSRASSLEILLVDDDKVVALLHEYRLKSTKISLPPIICCNGMEALERLHRNDHKSKHFLVLLDLNMPVVDGWKFLKLLKKNPPKAEVSVVIVTSSINQQDYLKSQSYDSVIHFCSKPLTADCLNNIKKLEQVQKFF